MTLPSSRPPYRRQYCVLRQIPIVAHHDDTVALDPGVGHKRGCLGTRGANAQPHLGGKPPTPEHGVHGQRLDETGSECRELSCDGTHGPHNASDRIGRSSFSSMVTRAGRGCPPLQRRAQCRIPEAPYAKPRARQQAGGFQHQLPVRSTERSESGSARDHASSRTLIRPLAASSPTSTRTSRSHRVGSTS